MEFFPQGLLPFPSFIRKTEQERIQNLQKIFDFEHVNRFSTYELTLKLDGSSFTAYINDGKYGICSRNYEIDLTCEQNNIYLLASNKYKLDRLLKDYHDKTGKNIAIQGELIGPNIQKNFEKVSELELQGFDFLGIPGPESP